MKPIFIIETTDLGQGCSLCQAVCVWDFPMVGLPVLLFMCACAMSACGHAFDPVLSGGSWTLIGRFAVATGKLLINRQSKSANPRATATPSASLFKADMRFPMWSLHTLTYHVQQAAAQATQLSATVAARTSNRVLGAGQSATVI
jgi:hypothetical protein